MAMNERQATALKLQREGLTVQQIADKLGIAQSGAKSLLERARRWEGADSALTAGATAIGADSPASVVWTKTDKDGNTTYSVMHSNKPKQADPSEIAEAIREGLAGIAPPPAPPKPHAQSDLLAIFPVADLHMGLLTDQEEVGEDWNTKKAQRVF